MDAPATHELMQTARHFQFTENRLADAEHIYRQILTEQPEHAEAAHFLGVLSQQVNRFDLAEPLIRRSIALRPDVAGFHNNLGELLRAQNKDADALASFQRALTLDPNFAEPQTNIALILYKQGRLPDALAVLQNVAKLHPENIRGLHLLGGLLLEMGQVEQAKLPLATVLKLQPNHSEAKFLYAAATGSHVPSSAPPEYIAGVFDNYADRFDDHLVRQLDYRVPALLKQAVDCSDPARLLDILDLGCGTGLTGALFRSRAKSLAGVDLSSKMILRAQQRRTYDTLEIGEILPALQKRPNQLDLVLAGDVFGYVGELKDVFTAARSALRPFGLFAFSVEQSKNPHQPFTLLPSRRYAHSRTYIDSLANSSRFEIISAEEQSLRKEANAEVPGIIFILRRP